MRKWTKYMKRHFTEEDTQMANKHTERYSASPATRKMEIQATVRYYYASSTVAKIEIPVIPSVGEDEEKVGHTHIAGGNVKWPCNSGKQFDSFL